MPIKILLADKSITIQKVVEMLFSGKDYEVLCVSDGETALNEASRVVPDVILADIDLPRIDGYTFAARLKQVPLLAQTPVILMMSRDDVFDQAKTRQASIVDHIAKPFESQELISKVKKAVTVAPPRLSEPAPAAPRPAAAKPQAPAGAPPRPAAPASPGARPKQAPPSDIFDIIKDAPSGTDLKRPAARREEDVYEVEPVVEVEEQLPRDIPGALPVGKRAVEEMREGLGLSGKSAPDEQEIVSFESLDMATKNANEYAPPRRPEPPRTQPAMPPLHEAREYVPPPSREAARLSIGSSDAKLSAIAEEVVSRVASEYFKNAPSKRDPQLSEEATQSAIEESASKIIRQIARDVVEKVAWEVVPDLAIMLIKEEIERLKAET
jgi:CheY-like chemotaxis protein